jgi:hypothetical protein
MALARGDLIHPQSIVVSCCGACLSQYVADRLNRPLALLIFAVADRGLNRLPDCLTCSACAPHVRRDCDV